MKSDLTKLILTGIFIILVRTLSIANNVDSDGFDIKIKLTDYKNDSLFLGYQVGNQTYIKDTAIIDKKSGFFNFKGETKLPAGIYLLIMKPDNNYFQIMVGENDQNFTLTTNTLDPYIQADLKNSKDNDVFFNYMKFLSDMRKEAETATALKAKDSINAVKKLELLDKKVKEYQHNLITKDKGTVSATLIKTAIEVESPKLGDIKNKDERDNALYLYYKEHWFDNFEMGNSALLRSPVLFQKVDYYLEKMTPQHPDSIIVSLDRIFDLMKPSKETFQYYFVHYLNQYAKSKIVGFDAIYVHLAKKYIESGMTEFLEKDNREKIVQNANKLAPILIGKRAPEIKVFKEDNTQIALSEIKSKYTVIFFFAPDCGHCQKQSPDLVAFLKKAKERKIDVKVLATCTYLGTDKVPECWKYAKEKGFDDFINTVDPFLISRYKTLYNVETTPQIFILDEDKIIRSKSIEAKQVEEVLDFIIQEDNSKLKKEVRGH